MATVFNQLFRASRESSLASDPEEASCLLATTPQSVCPMPPKKQIGIGSRLAKNATKLADAFDRFWLEDNASEPRLEELSFEHGYFSSNSDYSDEESSGASCCDCSECEGKEDLLDTVIDRVVIGKIDHLLDGESREVFAYDVQSPVFVGFLREDGTLEKLSHTSESSIARMSNPERRGPLLPDPTLAHIREVAALSSLDETEATNKVFWEAQRSLAVVPPHIAVLPLADGGRVYLNRRTGEVSDRHPNHEKYVAFFAQHTPPPSAAAVAAVEDTIDSDNKSKNAMALRRGSGGTAVALTRSRSGS